MPNKTTSHWLSFFPWKFMSELQTSCSFSETASIYQSWFVRIDIHSYLQTPCISDMFSNMYITHTYQNMDSHVHASLLLCILTATPPVWKVIAIPHMSILFFPHLNCISSHTTEIYLCIFHDNPEHNIPYSSRFQVHCIHPTKCCLITHPCN